MASRYELSKTYQYRKVMKPLLERKRRARINACLDDLKDLMAECMQQQSGDANAKLEKLDILEFTVKHLRRLKTQQNKSCNQGDRVKDGSSFRSGYIQAVNEMSRCLASLPSVDVEFGTKLMTHLGVRLNQLECSTKADSRFASNPNHQLSVNCSNIVAANAAMYSPVSSGYGSDSEIFTPNNATQGNLTSGLLKRCGDSLWQPWK